MDIQFEISCTEKKQTMLELPYSVKVLVKSIAYRPQEIIMYESDIYLSRVLLQNLNLAVSGFFLFKLEPAYQAIEQIIFFNCLATKRTRKKTSYLLFSAHPSFLSVPGLPVYAVASSSYLYSWLFPLAAGFTTFHYHF